MKNFRGRKVLINVPELKKSSIELTAKDEEAIMKDAMKLWSKLEVFEVGNAVEGIRPGAIVYVSTSALASAEKIEIDGSMKMLINDLDVIFEW